MSRTARFVSSIAGLALLACALGARSDDLPEYRLKAAFLFNFALLTEWPSEVGTKLNLCILGQDPFGSEIDELNGKVAAGRSIVVQRAVDYQSLKSCQILFISPSSMGGLPRTLAGLRGSLVLTVADSPGAARDGVGINMVTGQSKIAFEVNLKAVQESRLNLSSKLLRLAREVYQ